MYGYTLAELAIVTGLLSGLVLIIATIMSSTASINNRVSLSAYGLENLTNAQLALTNIFSQALNVRVVTAAELAVNATLDFRDVTDLSYYDDTTSRVLDDGTSQFISDNQTFYPTTVSDYSEAARVENTNLVALIFFEDQNSFGTATENLYSSVQAAAIYFQRPTTYTSGVLHIVRTLRTMTDAPGDVDLSPCTACPANVISQKYDGLVSFDMLFFDRPAASASVLDGGLAPITAITFRLITRSFMSSRANEWLWCPANRIANAGNGCLGIIGPHQNYDRIFTVSLRNNTQFTGKVGSTPSGGSDQFPIEERTLGPIYFFRPQGAQ